MNKYTVTYEIKDEEGETCNVWTYADNEEQAETIVRQEYWDIERIVSITKK
jgi:hypothetical protein